MRRRTFPGSVSNHHLGTLLGLLLAAYEMNHFKDEYQTAVLANAKAFARALAERRSGGGRRSRHRLHRDPPGDRRGGLRPRAGDGPTGWRPTTSSATTRPAPDEEGFTASGALRLGVAEMTRFGMGPDDFRSWPDLMAAVILENRTWPKRCATCATGSSSMRYCFREEDYPD